MKGSKQEQQPGEEEENEAGEQAECMVGKFDFLSSVQLLSHVRLFVTHGLQHTRLPCPSPLPKVAQTHVHRVGDAIQPSHLLSSPSPPAFNLSQHQGLFK